MYLFTSWLLMYLFAISSADDTDIKTAMEFHAVVPDLITQAPQKSLKVTYNGDIIVNNGNELTPTQVKDPPTVSWDYEADAFYILMMTSPDVPRREKPTANDMINWMIGNIPGNDISQGEVIVEYVGAGPGQGTGLHRYALLICKQPGKITFDEVRVSNKSSTGRFRFSTKKFIEKYNFGAPIAGNFFQAQYDDFTPILHKQIDYQIKSN